MIFLIDFENVSNSGFEGLERLNGEDKLIVFYSEKASTISISKHRELEKSKASKEYFSVKKRGKNALDFQLVSYLGYLISTDKKSKYCIISHDAGFDAAIEFWKEMNGSVKIIRCADLTGKTQEAVESEIEKVLPGNSFDTKKIVSVINKFKTKQGVNNALVKEYGSKDGGVIYQSIKPLLRNKKGR